MKAAIFKGPGRKLAIEDIANPVEEEGKVVVKVHACGVCGSDLHATEPGVFLQEEGTILGHEFAGEVISSSGQGITVGQRVTVVPVNPCGKCRECREGYTMLCAQNKITGLAKSAPGAYAQYIKVGVEQVVPLPDGVSYEEGALVEPLAVGLHAVIKSEMPVGARVLVIGAGPIGLSVTAFAQLRGAACVVVSERTSARREAARSFGASDVIDPTITQDVGGAFARIAGGPPDVIFECVGVPGLIQNAIDLSRARGTIVVVGVCMKEDTVIPISATLKELKLQFVLGYAEEDFVKVLDFLQAGRINAKAMVTDRVELAQLPDAFEGLRRPDNQIKLMIFPNT